MPLIRRGLHCALTVAMLLSVGTAAEAQKKGTQKGQKNTGSLSAAEKRKQWNETADRVRRLQEQLEALKRSEMQLSRQADTLGRALSGKQQRLKSLEESARQIERDGRATSRAIDSIATEYHRRQSQFAEITTRLEAEQPPDTPLGKAIAERQAAQAAYDQLLKEIAALPDYKVAYETAANSANRRAALPEVRRKWIDENPKVLAARNRLALASVEYSRLAAEVLGTNPQWSNAKAAVEEAQQKVRGSHESLAQSSDKVDSAKRDVATLRDEVRRSEAELKGIEDELKRITPELQKTQKQFDNARREFERLNR
ncbi:MAG: hypothetical protein ACOY3P_04395 [Planctomycetota bacterium]